MQMTVMLEEPKEAEMTSNEEISGKWETLYEIAEKIPVRDLTGSSRGGRNRQNTVMITNGLKREPFPTEDGLHWATPNQILSLVLPAVDIDLNDQAIKGFQRVRDVNHARKIARALLAGDEMPTVEVSVFPDGKAYINEGQHRCLAAVMARMPLEVKVKRRTVEQARKLFANQSKAKRLKADNTLLTGNSPIELYIQDALTDPDHPWADLVSVTPSAGITPTTMALCAGAVGHNALQSAITHHTSRTPEQFDSKAADELAEFIKAFGNRKSNPMAFKARNLRSISYAAVYISVRNPNFKRPEDVERWKRHMASFPFENYPHLINDTMRTSTLLVDHWNKRLSPERKVTPMNYR